MSARLPDPPSGRTPGAHRPIGYVEPVLKGAGRAVRVLRHVLLAFFGVPVLVATGLTLVDLYRRKGLKSKPFPHGAPTAAPVGDGTVTPYSFGRDLYDDMLAAIDGAQKQVFFET